MPKLADDRKIIIYSAVIVILITFIAVLGALTLFTNTQETAYSMKVHLEMTLTILFAIGGAGILLLYLQVLPLVRNMMTLKRQAEYEKIHLQTILDNVMEGIITTDNKGKIKDVNPMAAELFNYTIDELIGKSIWYLIPEAANTKTDEEINSYLLPGKKEVTGVKKNNDRFPLELSVRKINEPNGKTLFVGIMHDISTIKETESALSYQAHYDALTGLSNRAQLEHEINISISSAERYNQPFAIFFLDIDHFKEINDTYGHDVGDQLLKSVSERLKSNIRKSDIVARLGGDEFVIILKGAHHPDIASIFADKIIRTIKSAIKIKDTEMYITVSIGISFYDIDGKDYETLLKSADMALYTAKEKGRNNYQFCTAEMNAQVSEKLKLKNALRLAFANKEFHLVYQPKIHLQRQRISGFEAFLRWDSKEYGVISPIKIIALTDELGLTAEVGQWIIEKACEEAKKWNTASGITRRVTINISKKYYAHTHFFNSILMALEKTALPPQCLELEITESLIMKDPEYSLKTIKALQELGIQVTIDNFGTGYSSLSYLHQFSVNSIKTDRQFTQSLTLDAETTNFLRAIINLAKNLNIKVQAEGVETKEQYQQLFEMNCDEAQGYLFGHPMPYTDVIQLVKKADKQLQDIDL